MSRLLDLVKGVAGLALLLALVVGVPVLLLVIVGFPLPTESPDPALVRRHLEDGDVPDAFVIKTLALVVWVVWIQLAVAVLAEVVAVARGRVAGRAPVLPAIQLTARALVASTALIVSALTPTRSAAAVPITPIDAAPITAPVADPVSVSALDLDPSIASGTGLVVDIDGERPDASVDRAQAGAESKYRTSSTDSWWDMAERLLGDGMRWSEMRRLNEGKVMLTGETITARTEAVRPGWLIDVPADADPTLLDRNGTDRGGDGDDHRVTAEEAGLLARAIKPDTLIYEGPSGVVDDGPGIPYQVTVGDNLWDIAERHLGDPFRWPEIFERSNQLIQPIGHEITDPNLIWPDAVLWLPTDAVGVPQADVDLVDQVIGEVTVVDAVTADEEMAAADPVPVTAASIDGDDLEEIAARAVDAVHAADGAVDEAAVVVGDRDDGSPDGDPTDGGPLRGPAGVGFGIGGAALAAGLLGLLVRARRVRMVEAQEGQVPAPPPMELVEIETVLRNSADRPRSVSVHAAIRTLVDRPIVPGEPLAAPELVRMSGERIEVVQQGPDPDLPSPWMSAGGAAVEGLGGRSSAVLPAEFFPDAADSEPEPITPAIVTVGGGLLLNLEAVGVLAIEGRPEMAAGLVRSMVHELATGPARRAIDLRVSHWLPGADLHEHVLCSPLGRLSEELSSWMEDVELGLTASGFPSVYAVRAAGRGDDLAGLKIIFADPADLEDLRPILDRARRRSLPLAVVVAGDCDPEVLRPTATISLGDDTLRIEPYGFTAAMQYLDVDLILGAEALVNHARTAPMVPADQSAISSTMVDFDTDPAQTPTEETPQRDIVTELPEEEHEVTDRSDTEAGTLIRLLGPVEFEGGPEGLSEEERSMLTFLALVGPSTRSQLQDAVWPGRPMSERRWDEIVDGLRAKLGSDFPDGGDDRYRVRSVMTDLGAARRWVTQARSMSGERMRNLMQLALSDVRGRPFTGVDQAAWQWTADHKMAVATQATSMLIDACFDLCDSAHDADDIHLAKWACDVGSLVDPLHETMITRKVQLLVALGRSEEARTVVAEWERQYEATASRVAPFGPSLAIEAAQEPTPHAG